MKEQKILIMGLDNSGKTSIVLAYFKKNTNLLTYLSLKPTRGYKISHIKEENVDIVLWDFGGQLKYREKHMKDLLKHLEEADELIYVLDVQDRDRYDIALQYYSDIVHFLKLMEILPKIILYLHKCDPDLAKIDPNITDSLLADIFEEFYQAIFTVFEKNSFDFMKFGC